MNAPTGAAVVATLPVAAIIASASNPRKHFDEAYIAELADTIKSHGVIQPITVRPLSFDAMMAWNRQHADRADPAATPTYEIVVGECRWRASKLAGLADIPAFWRELDDRQVLEIQVIENLQRRDVHPLEEAEGYDRLIKQHGYQVEQIADKIGKSRAYVYARLKLAALCPTAREAFYAGKLDASTALLVARIPAESLQKKATKEITEGYGGEPLSYRAARDRIRQGFTFNLGGATFPLADATLVPAAGACTTCAKRSGNNPDLFGDIDDADVCTDTPCFDDKRAARHLQLITNAEKRNIPVITGDATRDFEWHHHTNLDDTAEGDGQERSYREILGAKAPVAALVEVGWGANKHLAEVSDDKALAAALKKAGWQPIEEPAPSGPDQQIAAADRKARDEEDARREAEREQQRKAADAEREWRERLSPALTEIVEAKTTAGEINTDRAIVLLASAWLRTSAAESYELPEELLNDWGIELPAEYDEDEELARITATMANWTVGLALAFLFDALTRAECFVERHNFDPATSSTRPHTLLALADLVGFDAESLRAPTPSDAAQAKTKGAKPKKAKAKSDPAPASPANEPAAPVAGAPTLEKAAWPFPAALTEEVAA